MADFPIAQGQMQEKGLSNLINVLQTTDLSILDDLIQCGEIVETLSKFEQLNIYIPSKQLELSYLKDIAKHLKLKKLKRGDKFLAQGEKFNRFYLILEGQMDYFEKKQIELLNQELNWLKTMISAQDLLEQEKFKQEYLQNNNYIVALLNKIEIARIHLKDLETKQSEKQLLLNHLELFKMQGRVCLYNQIDKNAVAYSCIGDIFDNEISSPYLIMVTKDTTIAYLEEEIHSKIFSYAKQQLNFISRVLEKTLSNGINQREIRGMGRFFKEKILKGEIYSASVPSKEIFIIKKGVVTLNKGNTKVAELTEGKLFGHENLLDNDRSVSAVTKGQQSCTLLCADIDTLKNLVGKDLLQSLSVSGQLKLRQYQETLFKLTNNQSGKQQILPSSRFLAQQPFTSYSPLKTNLQFKFPIQKKGFEGSENKQKNLCLPTPLLFKKIFNKDQDAFHPEKEDENTSQENKGQIKSIIKRDKQLSQLSLQQKFYKVREREEQKEKENFQSEETLKQDNEDGRGYMIECIKSFARKWSNKFNSDKRDTRSIQLRSHISNENVAGIIASMNTNLTQKTNRINSSSLKLRDRTTSPFQSHSNSQSDITWSVTGIPYSSQGSSKSLYVSLPQTSRNKESQEYYEMQSQSQIEIQNKQKKPIKLHFSSPKSLLMLDSEDEDDSQTFKLESKYSKGKGQKSVSNHLIPSPLETDFTNSQAILNNLCRQIRSDSMASLYQRNKLPPSPTKLGSQMKFQVSSTQTSDTLIPQSSRFLTKCQLEPKSENNSFITDLIQTDQINQKDKPHQKNSQQIFSNSLLTRHLVSSSLDSSKKLKEKSPHSENLVSFVLNGKSSRNNLEKNQIELIQRYSNSSKKEFVDRMKQKYSSLELKQSSLYYIAEPKDIKKETSIKQSNEQKWRIQKQQEKDSIIFDTRKTSIQKSLQKEMERDEEYFRISSKSTRSIDNNKSETKFKFCNIQASNSQV